jgi:hypothetical protein
MSSRKPPPPREPRDHSPRNIATPEGAFVRPVSISLAEEHLDIAERLTAEMHETTGRAISTSALFRALLRYAEHHKIDGAKLSKFVGEVRWGGKLGKGSSDK